MMASSGMMKLIVKAPTHGERSGASDEERGQASQIERGRGRPLQKAHGVRSSSYAGMSRCTLPCSKPINAYPIHDRSTHMSPDRITRHASPSRQSFKHKDTIVPRIPQPYRTSFSAVTSPRRVPRSLSETRGCRPQPLVSDRMAVDPSDSSQYMNGKYTKLNSRWRAKKCNNQSSGKCLDESDDDYSQEHSSSFTRFDMKYSSTPIPMCSAYTVKGKVSGSMTNGRDMDPSHVKPASLKMSPLSDRSASDALLLDTANQLVNSKPVGEQVVTTPSRSDPGLKFSVVKGTQLNKEYMHNQKVTYSTAVDKDVNGELVPHNSQTDKLVKRMLKGRFFKTKSKSRTEEHSVAGGKKQSGSAPASPEYIHRDRQGRSRTLPSEEILSSEKEVVAVKKSLSSSITNFLRRMSPSPKSPRKQNFNDHGRSAVTPPCGSNDSVQFEALDIDLENTKPPSHSQDKKIGMAISKQSPKSPKKRLFSFSKKSKPKIQMRQCEINDVHDSILNSHTVIDTSNSNSTSEGEIQQHLPSHSTRILKSIEVNTRASQEKGVYHAFKERQSPKHNDETVGLKWQALKAVEFPDKMLFLDSSGPPSPGNLNLVTSPPVTANHQNLTDGGSETIPPRSAPQRKHISAQYRKHDPPNTLNVRDAYKLNKSAFIFPSLSIESIGQCSLDISQQHAGSEPSLTSRNGHPASVAASKRTLLSQGSISSTSPKSHAAPHSRPSDVVLHQPAVTPSQHQQNSASGSSNSPKAPSYLKISCSLHGYKKYKGYEAPTEQYPTKLMKSSDLNSNDTNQSNDVNKCTSSSTAVDRYDRHNHEMCDTTEAQADTGPLLVSNTSCNGQHVHSSESRLSSDSADKSQSSHINGATPVLSSCVHQGKTPAMDITAVHCSPNKPLCSSDSLSNGALQPSSVTLHEDDVDSSCLLSSRAASTDSISTPKKDATHFVTLVEAEKQRLQQLACRTEQYLQSTLPEEACGKLRAAIGKANLLTTKKFKQFQGLCQKNMNQEGEEPFQTTVQDLAGFWDMVMLQVEEVNAMFDEIEKMRHNDWQSPVKEKRPNCDVATTLKSTPVKVKGRSVKVKDAGSTPRSAKFHEAAKAREEARRRLMLAKRVGRQRKISESDTDMVEIFVS